MQPVTIPHLHGKAENIRQVQLTLENREPFEKAAELFKMLSDENRIRIFWILCHREECVVNLSSLMGMSSPAVSHHLRFLKQNGLIENRRIGKEVHYRAAEGDVCRLLHKMVERVMEVACPRQQEMNSRGVAVQVHDYICHHLNEKCTAEEMAHLFHMNTTTLKKAFREQYGLSMAAHMKQHRLNKAAELLQTTALSVGEIAGAVGFSSQSRFAEAFRKAYHLLPIAYRKQQKKEKIDCV